MAFKLFGGTIHAALVHAVTEYDRREEAKAAAAKNGRGYYNRHALAQYLMRIDEVEADIAKGATPRTALLAAFNGRLLDHVLKAVGEAKFTREEMFAQPVAYRGAVA